MNEEVRVQTTEEGEGNSGIKSDTFGTFGKNNPTDGSTKRPIMKGEPKWSESVK